MPIYPAESLGHAILLARDLTLAPRDPEAATVIQYQDDGRFATIPSAEYARLRERSMHGGMEPLLSFLPHGGLDVHRAAFDTITHHIPR